MDQIVHDISHGYDQYIYEAGKQPQLILLLAFLLTFGFIRTSAHMIKAQVSWWPGNVETKGGLHIHHMVWGILLMILIGDLAIGIDPPSPGREILAFLFGAGMGLTLDEFALWLNLKDVYWTDKGRESIDAVIIAATLLAMLLLGLRFWLDSAQALVQGLTGIGDVSGEKFGQNLIIAATQFVGLVAGIVTIFGKRKRFAGVVGLFIPVVGIVGACRLAKPTSRWAKRWYGDQKMTKAKQRFGGGGGEPAAPQTTPAAA